MYVWNQWVFHQELTTGHNPLATEKILSLTSRVDLTQHNYTAFLNMLALPLISWLGIVTSFNVVFLVVCVLNAVMMYGLARQGDRGESVGGVAGRAGRSAWSPAMIARTTGHFSLAAAAALPAFLWCLVNAERTRSPRDAALVGVCMAWAALSDAYFGIYCLIIGTLYVGASWLRVTRSTGTRAARVGVDLDILIVCFGGLIAGLLLGRGGEFTLLGVPIHARSLYTPVLVLTVLVIARAVIVVAAAFRDARRSGPLPIKALLIAALACAGPLSPVLYGLTERVAEGRFVSPTIFWRSSPRGVDLLSFVTPNSAASDHALADRRSARADGPRYSSNTPRRSAWSRSRLSPWRCGARRYRPRAGWLAVTIGFALLALGPFIYIAGFNTHVPGPWALMRYVPVVGLARMPTRFAVVASIGVAVLMAGALASLGARWPHRRRLIGAIAAMLLVFELWPAPRTLYSAEISPIYDRIAADPRPVRVLVLPFGVRDGTWETGNFRPRSLFNQTRHGKALIGGYLSRVSPRRVERMRRDYPTLDALITLSEKAPIGPEVKARLDERGDRLVAQGNVGYVVIDSRFIPPDRAQLVIDALKLREVQRDQHLTLYSSCQQRSRRTAIARTRTCLAETRFARARTCLAEARVARRRMILSS